MNRDEKPIMKSDVGEFAEGGGFEIYSNLTTGYEGSPCPHCKDGVCPLVVVAWNEGGHNLTEVCLECVKDALHLIDKQRMREWFKDEFLCSCGWEEESRCEYHIVLKHFEERFG